MRSNTETQLHYHIGLAIARLQGPHERLTGTVVRVVPLKHGKLVRLEYSLGGPLRLITVWVKEDEGHPVGSQRNFCLEWRWDYKDRFLDPGLRRLSTSANAERQHHALFWKADFSLTSKSKLLLGHGVDRSYPPIPPCCQANAISFLLISELYCVKDYRLHTTAVSKPFYVRTPGTLNGDLLVA